MSMVVFDNTSNYNNIYTKITKYIDKKLQIQRCPFSSLFKTKKNKSVKIIIWELY